MNINDQFPSKYLRASDFPTETTVTMADVQNEEVGMDRDKKPVLYLEGYEKGVILNKTNSGTIANLYGDDTDEWKGESITLFSAMVTFQGETKPSIRMKAPSRKKGSAAASGKKPAPTPPPAGGAPPFDDEIPFAPCI